MIFIIFYINFLKIKFFNILNTYFCIVLIINQNSYMNHFSYSNYLNKVWILALVAFMVACSQFEAQVPDDVNLESSEELAVLNGISSDMWNARTSTSGVDPVVFNLQPGGNVACSNLDEEYNYSSGKWDFESEGWTRDKNTLQFYDDFPNLEDEEDTEPGKFTVIYDPTTKLLGWTFEPKIGGSLSGLSIIVKGGPNANVYTYEDFEDLKDVDGLYKDSGLSAPINPKNGQPFGLSNLTFCYNNDDKTCYGEETAWADGPRYQTPGNWATYTPYNGEEETVTLFAGQTIDIGDVKFTPEGERVRITINLTAGKFQDVAENIKIQGYADAPSGNPNPGGFSTHKGTVSPDETSYSVVVDRYEFYGVHVDAAPIVACEIED